MAVRFLEPPKCSRKPRVVRSTEIFSSVALDHLHEFHKSTFESDEVIVILLRGVVGLLLELGFLYHLLL